MNELLTTSALRKAVAKAEAYAAEHVIVLSKDLLTLKEKCRWPERSKFYNLVKICSYVGTQSTAHSLAESMIVNAAIKKVASLPGD